MTDNFALLEYVHELTAKSDLAVEKLKALDEEYAKSPMENMNKRLTIAELTLILNLQSLLIRHLMEENHSIFDQLESLNEKILRSM